MPTYDYMCPWCKIIYERTCKAKDRRVNMPVCKHLVGDKEVDITCDLIISPDTTTRHTWNGLAGRGMGRGIEKGSLG